MSARSRLAAIVVILSTFSCVRFDPPQGNLPGLVTFRAIGTAVADGQKSPGEWDKGDCTQFMLKVPGGGTVNADICMMNDGQSLHSIVSYPRTTVDAMLRFNLDFFTPGTSGPGSAKTLDQYMIQGGSAGTFPYFDGFPHASGMQPDAQFGGTNDGAGAIGTAGGMHIHELTHPLDTADDAHDYSLKAGDTIWFCAEITVGAESTDFPGACGATAAGGIFGRVEIAARPEGLVAIDPGAFAGRVCAVYPQECQTGQADPSRPDPCKEKPALCEKPRFQEGGMFLYCTIKPCVVHDELPRNCLVKFPCPIPPGGGGGQPPFYHLTFTGLRDDWDVVLVDRRGGRVPHRVVPVEGGVVLSFRPDREHHRPGLIGDYVAMFVLREKGQVGVRYDVRTSLATGNRAYVPVRRAP